MKELSLHLLDIAQNSVRGEAKNIDIEVKEEKHLNDLIISINDDGIGIPKDMMESIMSPFTTSRTTRRVGLGISLFAATCESCEGDFRIESQVGKGTKVLAKMKYDHIDRPPLGDVASTLVGLFSSYPEIRFTYKHGYNKESFEVDTDQIKEILDGTPMSNPQVFSWLCAFIKENIEELKRF